MDDLSKYRKYLGHKVNVVIDRPLGSKHPKWDFEYEVNYGYLPHTLAGDGSEIDAYVLGPAIPLEKYSGTCIAIIVRHDDNEHKLVVSEHKLSEAAIREQTEFVEAFYDTEVETSGLEP